MQFSPSPVSSEVSLTASVPSLSFFFCLALYCLLFPSPLFPSRRSQLEDKIYLNLFLGSAIKHAGRVAAKEISGVFLTRDQLIERSAHCILLSC